MTKTRYDIIYFTEKLEIMAGKGSKQYPLDRIIEQCKRGSKRCALTPKLTEEYLEHIDSIMELKQVEQNLINRKAINYVVTLRIIDKITNGTEELKNMQEFQELKNNICSAHKYWSYVRGESKKHEK